MAAPVRHHIDVVDITANVEILGLRRILVPQDEPRRIAQEPAAVFGDENLAVIGVDQGFQQPEGRLGRFVAGDAGIVQFPFIFLQIRLGGDHIGAVARFVRADTDLGQIEGGHELRL